jgi:hypothetical protein
MSTKLFSKNTLYRPVAVASRFYSRLTTTILHVAFGLQFHVPRKAKSASKKGRKIYLYKNGTV